MEALILLVGYLVGLAIGLFITYLITKAAVKNGVIEAHEIIQKKKENGTV